MAKDLKAALQPAPVFTGKGGYTAAEVEAFDRSFWTTLTSFIDIETTAKAQGVVATVGLALLLEKMRDPLAPTQPTPAATWYQNAIGVDAPSKVVVERLRGAWRARFLSADVIDRFEAELNTTRQREDESPQTFQTRLATLQRVVMTGRGVDVATKKADLHRRLVDGLDVRYRGGLSKVGEDASAAADKAEELWDAYQKIKDEEKMKAAAAAAVMAAAVDLQLAQGGRGGEGGRGRQWQGGRGGRGRGGRGRGGGGGQRNERICRVCGEKGHDIAECEKAICFDCHKTGHISYNCPEKGDKLDASSSHYTVEGERRWASVVLTSHKTRCIALVDPGSDASFLRQDVFARLPEGSWKPVDVAIEEATALNGTKIRVLGCAELELVLGHAKPAKVFLLITTGMAEEVLLGADVLKKFGVMGAIDRALRRCGAVIYFKSKGKRVESSATVAAVEAGLSPYIDNDDVDHLETPDLNEEQGRRLKTLLRRYKKAFLKEGRYPPPMNVPPQVINITGEPVVTPVRQARSLEVLKAQEIIEEGMVREGVARYVDKSRYRSEAVMVDKPSADPPYRHVIDYSPVNPTIEDDAWPMPRLEDVLRVLARKLCYVTMDGIHGFFQLLMADGSTELTTFRGVRGLIELTRMGQGLKVAPARYNKAVDQAFVQKLPGDVREILARYVDDFGFGTGTPGGDWDSAVDEALRVLEVLLKQAIVAGMTFKWGPKIQLLRRTIKFGGILMSGDGRRALDDKIGAIVNMGEIKTKRQMRSFIGATGALRWQIKRLDELQAPLLETVKGVARSAFQMTPAAFRAVEELKRHVAKAVTLAAPDPRKGYVMECDSSGDGFGLALFQDGLLVELFSCRASPSEKNMAPLDREWCCIYKGLERWPGLLTDAPRVEIRTDHQPLEGLERNRTIPLTGMRGAWMEALKKIKTAEVIYKPAAEMMLVDFFSRSPAFAEASRAERESGPRVAELTAVTPVRPTMVEWRAKQMADPLLAKVITYKETKTVPTDDAKEAAVVKAEADGYQLVDGVLVKLWHQDKGRKARRDTIEQVVVPSTGGEIGRILEEIHGDIGHNPGESIHAGTDTLYNRVRALYYWDNMWADCKTKRGRCYRCKSFEPVDTEQGQLQPTTTAMLDGKRRQAIDLFGPIKDADGSSAHVAVVISIEDSWPTLLLMKTAQAEEWLEKYIEKVYANEALPDELLSDRASNLNSIFCDKIYEHWGLEKLTTAAHNPLANGRAESLVKRGKGMVLKAQRALVEGQQLPLAKILPEVELALRTQDKSPMGITPFFARYGRDPKMPSYFKQPLDKGQLPPTLEQREAIFREVMRLMDEEAEESKERFDLGKRDVIEIEPGKTLVWIKDNEAGKTDEKRIGPFRAVMKKGPLDVKIEEVNGGPRLGRRHDVINLRQVEKFEVEKWPGQEEKMVEKVLDHKGGVKSRSYEVLWSDGSKTWEPSRHLIDYAEEGEEEDMVNDALRRYWHVHPRMQREAR
jgi:RNase H-like domain found in reverse transcriptase/Integrase zinc binding domain